MVLGASKSGSGSVSRRAMSGMWAAPLMVLSLAGSALRTAAQPSSNSDCALMVPLDEVRRGKGAYLSDCLTLSENDLGGCWTQAENVDTEGCQTCYIAEDSFADALFPVMFSEELEPCPTSVDFTTLYEEEYGAISLVTNENWHFIIDSGVALPRVGSTIKLGVNAPGGRLPVNLAPERPQVTAASLTSSACPEGWLFSSSTGHCYFKSPNTEKAADQTDAASKCEAEGAWLIAIDSEEENSFLVHNMLWIGFFGETYTGMIKTDGDSEWTWPEDAVGGSSDYDCLVDYSDWIEGPDLGCASEYNGGAEGESCMEIFPYEPKGWNPFSCNVGKHYVCEMVSSGDSSSTSSSNINGTATPSLAPTASDYTSNPITEPTPAPITVEPTAATTTGEPTSIVTAEPTTSATAEPTVSPTTEPTVSATPEQSASVTTEPTPIATAEPTVSATAEPTVSATAEPTSIVTTEPTVSATAELSASVTIEPTSIVTAEPTTSATAEPTVSATTEPTVSATAKPSASATTEPTTSFTSEPTSSVTSEPTATVKPSVVPSTAEPTTVVAAPTPAPTLSTTPAENATLSPTAPPSMLTGASDWEGYNTITVTKTGTWGEASYSIHFVPGEDASEIPVVEGVSKEGLGASEDEYGVKPGCYRMLVEVNSEADPTGVTWEISGGQPARPGDETSGEGLEGTLLTVGGGVCGVGSCHAECLADNFSSEDGSTSASTDVCDGYAALIDGVCSSICSEENGEDQAAFQNRCVSASCDPEEECKVDITAEDSSLQADYSLKLDVLVFSNTSLNSSTSSSSSTGSREWSSSKEFEMAVALWLGVDNEDVTVMALNGVENNSDGEENETGSSITSTSSTNTEGSLARRLELAAATVIRATVSAVQDRRNSGRILQEQGSNSSTSTERYTRYYCSVAPPGASSSDVEELEDSATDSNSTSALQSWLSENGGSAWTGVEVVEIDAQVLETMYFVPMSGDDSVGQESAELSESNSSITGGIVAGVVVAGVAVLIFLIAACIMFRRKRSRAKSSSTAGLVIIRDNDREGASGGGGGKSGGEIVGSFDDAVPVPSTTTDMSSAFHEHKASERAQDANLPTKATDSSGHASVPSRYHLTSASAAHGATAAESVTATSATGAVTVATTMNDSAPIVGESRGSSYYSSSCSSSAPLDPYKGGSNIAGPTSTSNEQRQQQQPGEASMKDSTFHSLEGVENGGRSGGVGAGRRSVDVALVMSGSEAEGDRYSGDGFFSEGSGRGSMTGESEAASRFGVVGGAKESHEMFAGNNWGTKPRTRIPPYGSHSTLSNSRTPVKISMASGNSISSSSSSSSASEVGWRGMGSKQQQHQNASNGEPSMANPSRSTHNRYPSTLSDDSDAASSAAWGANFPRSLSQRQQQQNNQEQGQRTHEAERFDIPAGDQDSDCESRPATHEYQQYRPRVGNASLRQDSARHASGYSYAGRVGFQPTISESWSGLPGMDDDSDGESRFYGDAEKGRRGSGIEVSSGYI